MSKFAKTAIAAGDQVPQASPEHTGYRLLALDGDALAYYCAGAADVDAGTARRRLSDKIASAQRASGATHVKILLTAPTSVKGERYAVASVKPYQGKRSSGGKPKNWAFLRAVMEDDERRVVTQTLEADDLFGLIAQASPHQTVICTQDKDMRMLPGWHLDWDTHTMLYAEPNLWAMEVDGKLYGRKWFWMQMLHGDTTDNVPGLPQFYDTKAERFKACGPVAAERILQGCTTEMQARLAVMEQYDHTYGEDWMVHMLEQAVLLWIRRTSDLFDCCTPGYGPMAMPNSQGWHRRLHDAMRVIADRVRNAKEGIVENQAN